MLSVVEKAVPPGNPSEHNVIWVQNLWHPGWEHKQEVEPRQRNAQISPKSLGDLRKLRVLKYLNQITLLSILLWWHWVSGHTELCPWILEMVGDGCRRSKPTAIHMVFTYPNKVSLLMHKILWISERRKEINNFKCLNKVILLKMEILGPLLFFWVMVGGYISHLGIISCITTLEVRKSRKEYWPDNKYTEGSFKTF